MVKAASKKKRRRSQSAEKYLSKMDPLLILGAALATKEHDLTTTRKAAVGGSASAGRAGLGKFGIGIHSLTDSMSARSIRRIEAEDLVPVLVAGASAKEIAEKVQSWNGRANALTDTTVSARVPRKKLKALAKLKAVEYVEASTKLEMHVDRAHLSASLLRGNSRTVPQTGKGVLVGVVDTGIDTTHLAFKVGNSTRIVNYLDQETGNELHQVQIDAGGSGIPADSHGHGTHVAGIAAGNGRGSAAGRLRGVAHEADLAIVKTTRTPRPCHPRQESRERDRDRS